MLVAALLTFLFAWQFKTALALPVSEVNTALITSPKAIFARAPPDPLCNRASEWRSRECAGYISPQAWDDVCFYPFGAVYYRTGHCPKGTYCANVIDTEGHDNVHCVTEPVDNDDESYEAQKGSIKIDFTAKAEQIVSVPVTRELDSASVSAQIRSSDGSFVVAVNNAIVGTLRGTNKKTCVYDSRTRECKPNQKYDLQSGSFIDFTFGLRTGQSGNLIYSILGPNAH